MIVVVINDYLLQPRKMLIIHLTVNSALSRPNDLTDRADFTFLWFSSCRRDVNMVSQMNISRFSQFYFHINYCQIAEIVQCIGPVGVFIRFKWIQHSVFGAIQWAQPLEFFEEFCCRTVDPWPRSDLRYQHTIERAQFYQVYGNINRSSVRFGRNIQ